MRSISLYDGQCTKGGAEVDSEQGLVARRGECIRHNDLEAIDTNVRVGIANLEMCRIDHLAHAYQEQVTPQIQLTMIRLDDDHYQWQWPSS